MFDDFSYDFPAAEKITVFLLKSRRDYDNIVRTMRKLPTVLHLLVALALTLIVLFQSGKSQGLSGAIGGIADSYMSRSKAKSMDAKLARDTKWVAAVFVVLTLVLDCMVAAGIK